MLTDRQIRNLLRQIKKFTKLLRQFASQVISTMTITAKANPENYFLRSLGLTGGNRKNYGVMLTKLPCNFVKCKYLTKPDDSMDGIL